MAENSSQKKRKREVCQRCTRPTPQACICLALPPKPLHLRSTRVIVLQHPNESKRKNRSLPLIELCLACDESSGEIGRSSSNGSSELMAEHKDFTFNTTIARWWGKEVVDPLVWKIVNNPDEPLMLCFPSDDSIPVQDALETILFTSTSKNTKTSDSTHPRIQSETNEQNLSEPNSNKKINIIFIDGTWKYAKEMDSKTTQNGGWPKHVIRIKISNFENDFKPRRFDIRTPPSQSHLSTAECIAQVLKVVEDKGTELYEALMRPLDLMVQQWHSFQNDKKKLKMNDKKI